jgi:hypothetical protein
MLPVSIITTYHFGASDPSYDLLLESLRSSLGQLEADDQLILVANGVRGGAEQPERLLKDLDSDHEDRVRVVTLDQNQRNVGALNAGVRMILDCLPSRAKEWIGSVQSNVVLGPEWLRCMKRAVDSTTANGLFGSIFCYDKKEWLWAEGHFLKEGKTYYVDRESNWAGGRERHFPCLSAALFTADLVRSVVNKYGDFVCEHLEHYGDCTDVALRAKSVGGTYSHYPNAIAHKRPRPLDQRKVATSQILASARYYREKRTKAEAHLKNSPKYAGHVVDALRCADEILRLPYSRVSEYPPTAELLETDQSWRQ